MNVECCDGWTRHANVESDLWLVYSKQDTVIDFISHVTAVERYVTDILIDAIHYKNFHNISITYIANINISW